MPFLERDQPLSKSLLWKLQEQAYNQFGIAAWGQKGVPSSLTSNPFIAKSYAHIVLGYLRDCIQHEELDFSSPFYIFDLGAGSGRFAYLFLKEWEKFSSLPLLKKLKIKYVLTDISEANIRFWQQHPLLKPYFEKGIVDCAFFKHDQKKDLQLLVGGDILSKACFKNPIALIANYFFDTIPQDFFRKHDGFLEEGLISLKVEKEYSSLTPALINELQSSYTYKKIKPHSKYYQNAIYDPFLEDYSQLISEGSFLFPIGAFDVINTFQALTQTGFLVVASDQGLATEKQLKDHPEPNISLHGSFSIGVNYHALSHFIETLGGISLLPKLPDPTFITFAAVIHQTKKQFPETALAYHDFIESFSPIDYWKLISKAEEQIESTSLDDLILLVKLGNWDPISFHAFFPKITHALPHASENQKLILVQVIEQVWEHFYPISPEEGHFILNLGVLLFEMKLFEKAQIFFERARNILGDNPIITKNIKACQCQISLRG